MPCTKAEEDSGPEQKGFYELEPSGAVPTSIHVSKFQSWWLHFAVYLCILSPAGPSC